MDRKEPIRVLQVFGCMNRGGAETMIMNLYRHVDKSKIQFDFIVHTDEEGAYDKEIKQLGGNIYRVPRYTVRNHVAYVKAWQSFFKLHTEYKIMHSHIRSTASIYLPIAKRNKLVTIVHSHSTSSGSGIASILKNIYQYPLRYQADYYFACSKIAGIWLFGKKVTDQDNFIVLKNAIETEKFMYNEEFRRKIRSELKIEDKFVVGHVGRFNFPKNHPFIIDIFKEVVERHPESVLLLVGEGEERQKIEDKVAKQNLQNKVIFAGVREDIPQLLNAMDVFLFPSLFEGLPVSLIEAQANDLQIFASDQITDEVAISSNLNFISLEKTADEWASNLVDCMGKTVRIDKNETIKKAGYDILESSKYLQDYYIAIYNDYKVKNNL